MRRIDRRHRTQRWGALLGAVLLLLGGAAPARAQTPRPARPRLSKAEMREARRLFNRGLAAFAKQAYPDALAFFLASYKIKAKSIVLYNIAMCHKALFQYTRSIVAFRKYIERRGKKLTLAKRRQIESIVVGMEKKLGQLKLAVHPAGARVRVDGRVLGRAPLVETILLDPGRRMVEVSKKGYRTATLQLTVVAGQLMSMGVRLQAEERKGKVVITCRAPNARAGLEGQELQPVPLTLSLSAGEHRIRVTAPEHSAVRLTVRVRAGETVRQAVGLIPLRRTRLVSPSVPVYKKWWFWTILSSAVTAAAVTTGVLVWQNAQETRSIDYRWQLR